MTINALGFPLLSYKGESVVNVRVLDKNGRMIKRYNEYGEAQQFVALWWGVPETEESANTTTILAYKNALHKIAQQINQDKAYLNSQLQ